MQRQEESMVKNQSLYLIQLMTQIALIQKRGKGVIAVWKCLPQYMKDAFIRAFSKDSLEKGHRVVELEWLRALTRFRSDICKM